MHCRVQLLMALALCLLAVAQGHKHCPEGDDWYHLNDRCYHLSAQTEGWFGAEKHCQSLGGNLVTIHNAAENRFLHAMGQCGTDFWIGMVKTDVRKREFSWWDDSLSNYTDPLSVRTSDYFDCVYLDSYGSSRWYNTYCQTLRPYVCVTSTSSMADVDHGVQISGNGNLRPDLGGGGTGIRPPPQPVCPTGWLHLEGSCYFVSSEKANYFNAQMSCQAKGSVVASVLSSREQTLLTMALGCNTQAWIGLEKVAPCLINPSQATCWMWMDRTPVEYSVWHSGHPSNSKEVECAISDGRWRSANCYNEYRYVCKKEV